MEQLDMFGGPSKAPKRKRRKSAESGDAPKKPKRTKRAKPYAKKTHEERWRDFDAKHPVREGWPGLHDQQLGEIAHRSPPHRRSARAGSDVRAARAEVDVIVAQSITSTTCAFCGYRPAVAWANHRGSPRRICAKCRSGTRPKEQPVIDQVSALLPSLPKISITVLRQRFPRASRSSLAQALWIKHRRGELVKVGIGPHSTTEYALARAA